MNFQVVLSALLAKEDLIAEEMSALMRAVMSGELTPVQIAGAVVALRAKGETVTEIAAAVDVMRDLSTKVQVIDPRHLVDTCGTGGDSAHTFNISTVSAIVASAAGAKVAKHGGRSVSSTCGSADVLEHLGVNVAMTPEQVAKSVDEIGIGFMFAPSHHSAMRFAAPVRKELGIRTIFNLLGPMTNPAGARNQVMGVFHRDLVLMLAEVLKKLGSEHVLVVHGEDGLDEISIGAPTYVAELKGGKITEYTVSPEQFDLPLCPIEAIRASGREDAEKLFLEVLDNKEGPARDIVLLNAGAAIYVAGLSETLSHGVDVARFAIASGNARAKLDELVAFSKA